MDAGVGSGTARPEACGARLLEHATYVAVPGCEECAHDCGACGWSAGHSTQFLRDTAGRGVARLTNDTHQLGTLWLFPDCKKQVPGHLKGPEKT